MQVAPIRHAPYTGLATASAVRISPSDTGATGFKERISLTQVSSSLFYHLSAQHYPSFEHVGFTSATKYTTIAASRPTMRQLMASRASSTELGPKHYDLDCRDRHEIRGIFPHPGEDM